MLPPCGSSSAREPMDSAYSAVNDPECNSAIIAASLNTSVSAIFRRSNFSDERKTVHMLGWSLPEKHKHY